MDMSALLGTMLGGGSESSSSYGGGSRILSSTSRTSASSASSVDTQGLGGFVRFLSKALGSQRSDSSEYSSSRDYRRSETVVLSRDRDYPEYDDLDDVSEDMLEYMQQLQPLQGQQQEVVRRMADLAVNGGLDAGMLGELDDDQLAELAQWIADGAGGLFSPLAGDLDMQDGVDALAQDDGTGLDFGLNQKYAALMQLQQLQEKISQSKELNEESASLLDLGGLSGLTEDELAALAEEITRQLKEALAGADAAGEAEAGSMADKLAEVMKAVAEANRQAAEANGGAEISDSEFNLEDVLKKIDGDTLKVIVESALEKVAGDKQLPEIPDVVLRSLALDIVKVTEGDTSAAQQREGLFDLLGSNDGLREQLLQELAKISELDEQGNINQNSEKMIENIESMLNAADGEGADDDIVAPLVAENSGSSDASESEGLLADEAENKAAAALLENEQKDGEGDSDAESDAGFEFAASMKDDAEGEGEENGTKKIASAGIENGEKFKDKYAVDEESLKMAAFESESDDVEESESGVAEDVDFSEGFAKLLDGEDRTSVSATRDSAQTDPSLRQQQLQENIDRLEKMMQVSQGRNLKNVSMELNPRQLGKVIIDVSYHEGKVHTTIRTENEAARDMLMSGSEQLKKNLEAQGVKIETFNVFVDREGGGEGRNQEAWTAAQNGQGRKRKKGNAQGGENGSTASVEGIDELGSETESLGVTMDGRVNLLA